MKSITAEMLSASNTDSTSDIEHFYLNTNDGHLTHTIFSISHVKETLGVSSIDKN